ncbi:trehalose-phosphatase [Thermoplasmatales archaeon SW_10_69_26]|nr:MAG: trehalose-phosphatase [Thermoplasmatales archaeon SW_10_69_26]
MTTPRPRPIDDRGPITDRLSDVEGLLVGTDFDGTLSPIVDDPDDALPSADAKRALRRLAAHPATVVALVSGRSLSDLRPRVGLADVIYVGNHGLEIDRGGPPRVHPEARDRRRLVHRACRTVREALGHTPVRVEGKGLTATVHLREAEDRVRERALGLLEDCVEAFDHELWLSSAEAAIEIRPAVDWDKGDALRNLADDAPEGWTTLYLGDEETDEDAFEALGPGEVGIHVGNDPDTAAGYRLPEQAQVGPFLDALAEEVHGEDASIGAPSRGIPVQPPSPTDRA